ncbi:MAG: hypothetical protein K6G11_03660 [Lachnospiraceae bacterium]|nr:hypothetical protein [Lachnospiraceae bacterium]
MIYRKPNRLESGISKAEQRGQNRYKWIDFNSHIYIKRGRMMEGIIQIKDVIDLSERELLCKFEKVDGVDFMYEASRDYCIFSPISMFANNEYYTLQISEKEYEKLMDHETALLIIRHYGGYLTMIKFSHLSNILTKKTLQENKATGDKYYELHIHKEYIEAVGSQIVIKHKLTKL